MIVKSSAKQIESSEDDETLSHKEVYYTTVCTEIDPVDEAIKKKTDHVKGSGTRD
jgi:hypothetical protein